MLARWRDRNAAPLAYGPSRCGRGDVRLRWDAFDATFLRFLWDRVRDGILRLLRDELAGGQRNDLPQGLPRHWGIRREVHWKRAVPCDSIRTRPKDLRWA